MLVCYLCASGWRAWMLQSLVAPLRWRGVCTSWSGCETDAQASHGVPQVTGTCCAMSGLSGLQWKHAELWATLCDHAESLLFLERQFAFAACGVSLAHGAWQLEGR